MKSLSNTNGFCVAWVALGLGFAAPPAIAQDNPLGLTKEDFADEVQELAETELSEWISDPVIIYAIKEQNKLLGSMSDAEIEAADQQWQRDFKASDKPMIWDLLDRQASIICRDRREATGGVITEIIIMDDQGLNVAISDPTSDYYQGDEAKYQETFLVGKGAVHVSELYFDESTQTVQTQVSLPVTDPEDGDVLIGAVTFGVNVQKLR
ncbi:MAG: PDC sensor domain-containing protein [Paracoccaceae bacterium]